MFMQASRAAGLAMMLWASAALAEPGYSFDTSPGNLPKSVVPSRYAIELAPDLQNLAIAGSETIDIDVREPVSRVVLNAVDIAIEVASIDDGGQRAEVSFDSAAEAATLSFASALSPGPHKLHLIFTAKVNAFGRGLFYVDYPTDGGVKRMISSQLEPADARRIFPCWDELRSRRALSLR
jgi:aminopeptidase N